MPGDAGGTTRYFDNGQLMEPKRFSSPLITKNFLFIFFCLRKKNALEKEMMEAGTDLGFLSSKVSISLSIYLYRININKLYSAEFEIDDNI
jgi:hypothetical protein